MIPIPGWKPLQLWGWRGLLAAAVYAALPTIGLFSGGAYAALVFGLAGVLVLAGVAAGRWPSVDRPLGAIGALALALFWISATWSIVPKTSLSGSLQMTGIFVGALLLVGMRQSLAPAAPLIFRVLLIAAIVGPALVILDKAAGYPILGLISGHSPKTANVETRLARGLSQTAILIWPILAFARISRRPLQAGFAAILTMAMLVLTVSDATAALVDFAAGAIAFLLCLVLPRLVAAAGAVAIGAAGLATPWLITGAEEWLLPVSTELKDSATHRLEIWDYMVARSLERPLSGWGWLSANALPIHPDELARYHWVSASGTPHPHDFWLQLWVETGPAGAVLGSGFALLMLWRAWRQPADVRPFAIAAVVAAFATSLASFNLATDAWWGAAAAAGLLFAIMKDGAMATDEGHKSRHQMPELNT